MERDNKTSVSEFLLLGFPIRPKRQALFYILFLSMYLTTLFGNLLIILLIRLDSHLRTPMYFFLSHLAFTDVCFSSVTTPKMLVNMQTGSQTISYNGCISQMYFFIFFTDLDSFLLTAMAYDRYVAICHPLHYTTVMSLKLCILLVVGSWTLSCFSSLTHTLLLARLSFCEDNTSMGRDNETSVSEFLLLGLPIRSEQQVLFYILFLSTYLTTLFGNLLIILLIRLDSHLRIPMYFFLSHLAFTDVCFSSVTTPKMLANMQTGSQTISYNGCISQMYFFIFFTDLDSFLLTAMAYDRYVAICHPLHYTTVMSHKLCILLVFGSWTLSCFSSLTHTLLLARLSFCADNTIAHYFCDYAALLKLSCSDISLDKLVIFTVGVAVITLPLICVLVSYIHILAAILKIPSTKGIYKALSTCGSHLSVVSLYYGTIIGQYFFPSSSNSNIKDIIFAMMYTGVTPMLNPFIYSLRNRDINGALKNILSKGMFSSPS
ncbi:olfactory receptor 1J4-like [Trichosurus vulpecula]|uniref:olfactory receptor 1J4-like n=1 Tax=Trichosurus vulpecula TaxID=9337 RepID=UPI00186AC96B|nr:olfactory receptor 1J4-like [Trichosurus vulpecula]